MASSTARSVERGEAECTHHQHRTLALPEIVETRFAGRLRAPEQSENVVTELEREADSVAVALQLFTQSVVGAGECGADLQRTAHRVPRRLEQGHTELHRVRWPSVRR